MSKRRHDNCDKWVRALVLGAGGAARAMTLALVSRGYRAVVLARRETQAHELSAAIAAAPPEALEEARQVVPQGHFALLSAEDLSAYPQAHFQVLIAKHVVEHLPHPEQAVAEMSRVLSPGGLLLLATPNLDSPMRLRKKEQWIGYQDPTHISLRPPAEWLELLRQHGLASYKVFSDGFWDAPYMRGLPTRLQKLIFGLPGGLQAVFGWSIIPLRWGESLIALARRR